ncbi:MAG: energy-coupling factor ABC transporter permease, partial [Dehalococcoidia bacterium]|nr:energy-coupling factor ABC transporter permease [Dehalococcoidia bacterium]
MHIPDGYLSPATSAVMYAAVAPFWYLAGRKVKKLLTARMVPVLAIFSAFAFAVQMFNVPLPGGTTGHAVGATLLAIVLGPWAAVIGISMVLIVQALFFGDGGVTAIGANAFNMAVIGAFTGYFTYRLFAGSSPVASRRHVIGAIAGSYLAAVIGISMVLIVQALFFGDGGVTAIGANAFNMAVIGAFTGYFTYRLFAGSSPVASRRHV